MNRFDEISAVHSLRLINEMRRPRSEHQLANDRPNEIWLGFLDDFQRRAAAEGPIWNEAVRRLKMIDDIA
ncbi:hypothetical protein [Sphingobium fuliginis]|uniref:Uncharacterized protein n=1 Tax=Sphingobium fuliginis ATCC 27551 TaxID=1208342 RepID=A0A5B8CFR6_SPHSA|nr:hypothetical protein [Sphingobium fuliginis]QDC36817.1 hypothetical protein FIL70_05835 [Sphingobium fuliginis ATCC 27551]